MNRQHLFQKSYYDRILKTSFETKREELLGCSPAKKILVIRSEKKVNMFERSAYSVGKQYEILIGEPHSITKLGSGDISVELYDSMQVDHLWK